jgi:hypothetical protein
MIDRFLESKKKAAASTRPGHSSSTSSLSAGVVGGISNAAGCDFSSKQYRFTEEIKAMMRVFGDPSPKAEVAQALEGIAKVGAHLRMSQLSSLSVRCPFL